MDRKFVDVFFFHVGWLDVAWDGMGYASAVVDATYLSNDLISRWRILDKSKAERTSCISWIHRIGLYASVYISLSPFSHRMACFCCGHAVRKLYIS